MSDYAGDGMTGRSPPHNLDAERSVLGGVLVKPSAFDEVATSLQVDDFFLPAHREIFEATMARVEARLVAASNAHIGHVATFARGHLPGATASADFASAALFCCHKAHPSLPQARGSAGAS